YCGGSPELTDRLTPARCPRALIGGPTRPAQPWPAPPGRRFVFHDRFSGRRAEVLDAAAISVILDYCNERSSPASDEGPTPGRNGRDRGVNLASMTVSRG